MKRADQVIDAGADAAVRALVFCAGMTFLFVWWLRDTARAAADRVMS